MGVDYILDQIDKYVTGIKSRTSRKHIDSKFNYGFYYIAILHGNHSVGAAIFKSALKSRYPIPLQRWKFISFGTSIHKYCPYIRLWSCLEDPLRWAICWRRITDGGKRRLLNVAMIRAGDELQIISTKERMSYGQLNLRK